MHRGQIYYLVGFIRYLLVTLGGAGYHKGTTGLDLLNIAYQLIGQGLEARQGNYSGTVLYKGYGAVLQLPCGVGLGVDVGYFLKL